MWTNDPNESVPNARDFRTTHWSMVLHAGLEDSPRRDTALERLCRTYWYPIYYFIRRRGHDSHQAQDLTQGFFERFLQKNYLADVSAEKGRFRTFLLSCVQHFLANEHDRSQALKRGGGVTPLSLDERDDEGRFQFEPRDELTPEKAFERRWVEAVLESVLTRLRDECNEAGHEDRFERLKAYLVEDKDRKS